MRPMRIGLALAYASAMALVAAAAPAGGAQPRCQAGVLHPVGTPTAAYSAAAIGATRTYRRPGGELLSVFPRLNKLRFPTTFSIVGAIVNARCGASWYRVKVPVRPNGVVGYVHPGDVVVRKVTTRISVDLSRRTLSLYRRGRLVLTTPVAVGTPETPTPIGRYYVNQRITVIDPEGPYGPAVLGVSAFSNVLTGWADGAPIGIHGTNQPWSIGQAASNGCIRVPNATLLRLFAAADAGTPVVIHP